MTGRTLFPLRRALWRIARPSAVRDLRSRVEALSPGGPKDWYYHLDFGLGVQVRPELARDPYAGESNWRFLAEGSSYDAELNSRLWDVAPNGERTLVSRAAYRLRSGQSGDTITFQLNGNGYKFERGHVVKLELLGRDAPFLRASNTQFTVTVSDGQASDSET